MQTLFTCELPIIRPNAVRYTEWDGINWQQTEGWRAEYRSDRIQWGIHIKEGFVTDGGSIPKRLQGNISPLGIGLPAYLVHDALYASELIPREQADLIMKEVLKACGVSYVSREAQYLAVRACGWAVWKKHTKESIEEARNLIEWHLA